MDSPPSLSFIGIVDFSQEARWIFMTGSVTDLLGFEPHELIGRPSLELVHPEEFPRVRKLHYDTISQDKAAALVYLRMRHKNPYKGYVLCGISRTVVHNVLVGSVSFASPGAKALHNASTAQEVTVITPSAKNFEFRRWDDPSPMSPSPVPQSPERSVSPCPSDSSWTQSSRRSPRSDRARSPSPVERGLRQRIITFAHLPCQSYRTAFILDRFTRDCIISYCSNDLLISTTSCIGRSFFDFVAKKEEERVRSWLDCVKSWGVNETGQPSDGGFGFGRFALLTEGRDSIERAPEPTSSRHRRSSASNGTGRNRASRSINVRSTPSRMRPVAVEPDSNSPQIIVDAIFSAHSDGVVVILRRGS